ncbi:MAG: hypothetical protein Q9163_000960 [Psora crenata]
MPKPLQQKAPKAPLSNAPLDHTSDPRFANLRTDPRFRLPSRKQTHVTLDKRFARMLRDEDFSARAKVDRYGRPLPQGGARRELQKYYRLDDEDNKDEGRLGEEEEEEEDGGTSDGGFKGAANQQGDEEDESSSSSDDEESLEDEEEDEVFGVLEDQEGGRDGIPKGQVSSRLAVVNLDWDNIRAADLMAVFSSFIPTGGRILNITIYPSEFGRERMEREEMEGPPKEIFGRRKPDEHMGSAGEEEDEEDGEENAVDDEAIKKSILKEDPGNEFDSSKLRRYQLERLRYYYAVITCSSTSTAQAIYDAVDGTEYLTTANFFDLRYIPDSTDFSEDRPRDECDRIPDGYRPNDFVTDALQHSKVKLTWDADDGGRKEAQKRAFAGSRADIDENDLKAYLGSDTSDDDAPEPVVVDASGDNPRAVADQPLAELPAPGLSKKEAERRKMRALLGLAAEPGSKKPKADKTTPVVGDMQITFSSGLNTSDHKGSVFENTPEEAQETTVEKYVRKEKERKARRKEKLKAARNSTNGPAAQPQAGPEPAISPDANDAATKDLGFDDPFFAAAGGTHETPASKRKAEKREKRRQREAEEAAAASKRAELELLMMDDRDGLDADDETRHHFDMNALARAEKVASKSKKPKSAKRLSERDKEALEMRSKDQFELDVADERFRHVFERAEFAIDPSHPRYMGTEGMRRLLKEGRQKRANDEDAAAEMFGVKEDREVKKRMRGRKDDVDDVRQLVKRVKQKSIVT